MIQFIGELVLVILVIGFLTELLVASLILAVVGAIGTLCYTFPYHALLIGLPVGGIILFEYVAMKVHW